MTPPKAVVFDIGNVLIHWGYEINLVAKFGVERTYDFLEQTNILEVHARTDAGAPFTKTILEHAQHHPLYTDMIEAWMFDSKDMAAPEIEGSARVLFDLKAANVLVYALSNFAAENYEWSKSQYPVLQAFDAEFISGRMGMDKPHPEIYAALELETGLNGSDRIFADDRADNIAAARERGWHEHVLTTAARFRAELTRLGLL